MAPAALVSFDWGSRGARLGGLVPYAICRAAFGMVALWILDFASSVCAKPSVQS